MSKHTIELFYGLTCPHCRTLKKILKEILPAFDERFELKETLVSSPPDFCHIKQGG